jgi:hypothetical protein
LRARRCVAASSDARLLLRYSERIFPDERPRAIAITVRSGNPAHIQVACDGETIVDWQGDPTRLTLDARYWTVGSGQLMLGSWDTGFKITKLRLTPLPP